VRREGRKLLPPHFFAAGPHRCGTTTYPGAVCTPVDTLSTPVNTGRHAPIRGPGKATTSLEPKSTL